MSETKIQLSQEELELAMNAQVILTKNAIIEKVKSLFSDLQLLQQEHISAIENSLPGEIGRSRPKIYRGEKYNDLPYVLLDYPQVFGKENVFAIRTLFWWGHFFSSTLHLSGTYKRQLERSVVEKFETLKNAGAYVCINKDEWEHHFDDDNYLPLTVVDLSQFENLIMEKNFIKLAMKTPVDDFDQVTTILLRYFRELAGVNRQDDGKAL